MRKNAEIKFKEINEAYECLSDQQKRDMYNIRGHQDPSAQHNQWHSANMNADIFKDIFSMFGQRGTSPYQGMPEQRTIMALNVSLEDVYTGKLLRMPGNRTLNIPAGARHGARFIIDSQIYQLAVQPHPKFKRADDDLLVDVEINAIEAMLGIDVLLTHLNNATMQFTVPAGIQSGQIVRLSGKGLRNPEIDKIGDLMIRVAVSTPKNLSEEQKIFLKTMAHRDSFNI